LVDGKGHLTIRQYFSPKGQSWMSPAVEVMMLFNKKPGNDADKDYSGHNESRSGNGAVALNLSIEALRERSGTPARSVIDAWLTMKGNLESEGDIQVDGKVQGHIRCMQLIVGKDATIDGDVVAAEVVVRGRVKGVIRANRVKLQETACVESEIFFEKSLGIEDGASFEGQIRRVSQALTDPDGLSCHPAEIDSKLVAKSPPRREREVARMARVGRESSADNLKDAALQPEESAVLAQQG
jgi:cytoskeletal protein CcmA (bactofilin family)